MTAMVILELYPQHLAVNGDMGNVLVLEKRLTLAGIEVTRLGHNPGDELPVHVDLVTIGTGPVSAQKVLEPDVARIAPRLRSWRDDGVPMLAVTGGMQLLGESIVVPGGDSIVGAGVFGIETDAARPRIVTNCFVVESAQGRLVGIENHGSRTTLAPGAVRFGTVLEGVGNDDHRAEGVVAGNAIGTHLQGPVLAMNPSLADHLIGIAAERAGVQYLKTPEHTRIDGIARQTRALLTHTSESVDSQPIA